MVAQYGFNQVSCRDFLCVVDPQEAAVTEGCGKLSDKLSIITITIIIGLI